MWVVSSELRLLYPASQITVYACATAGIAWDFTSNGMDAPVSTNDTNLRKTWYWYPRSQDFISNQKLTAISVCIQAPEEGTKRTVNVPRKKRRSSCPPPP